MQQIDQKDKASDKIDLSKDNNANFNAVNKFLDEYYNQVRVELPQ